MEPMTKCSVRDLEDGAIIDGVLLVREIERRQKRDGAPYYRLTLADRTGSVAAVLWEADEPLPIDAGDAAHVAGRLSEHPRYGRQVTIAGLTAVTPSTVPWDDLVDGPERPVSELCEDLDALISSVRDPHLSALLAALLDARTPTGSAYREAPAAKTNHHAYRAGLLEHSVGVAQLVGAAAMVFPAIDRDLAVC